MSKRINITVSDETAQALQGLAELEGVPATTLAGRVIDNYLRNYPLKTKLEAAIKAVLGSHEKS